MSKLSLMDFICYMKLLGLYLILVIFFSQHYNFALETHDLVELRDVMAYLENCYKDFQRFPQNPTEEKIFYGYFQSNYNELLYFCFWEYLEM